MFFTTKIPQISTKPLFRTLKTRLSAPLCSAAPMTKRSKGKQPKPSGSTRPSKGSLVDIAASTLEKITRGSYDINGHTYNAKLAIDDMNKRTAFYSADSNLAEWRSERQAHSEPEGAEADGASAKEGTVKIAVSECSMLAGARELSELVALEAEKEKDVEKRVGVLNFASAKNPGGGFLKGASAQEESIARSSTLYPSLLTPQAQQFYHSHRKDPKEGYYSHAMIYSPHVLLIRTDSGDWHSPVPVEMATSCAVNAGVVRRYLRQRQREGDESELDEAMKERMARVLYLFERHGVRNLVLGSFGTGVFRNRVELVAETWRELLVGEEARFGRSFDRVVFAILGRETFGTFQRIFSELEDATGAGGVRGGKESQEVGTKL
ncbi:unnamed protein product [Cyclocybe aegerita]|uniref:Microbial-type PARG catalytic domain-containing protein n=1 Tax=Cyclocybe aegerita TaxID=1973307 RepID=A0A8S0WEX7_CYCAE|nr:unnamed protein product [Cyclocybe aegerita]